VTSTFKRDRYFWAVAMQTVCVNIFLGSFGPTQPLLRADQGTSLTIAGLHGTSIGLASVFAGLANPHIAHRFGRTKTAWIGLLIFSIGIIAFVASPSVLFSIPTAFVTGFGVSITINNALGYKAWCLYDVNGKVVSDGKVVSNQFDIDTRPFTSGLYVLKLQGEIGFKSMPIAIAHP
jgi:MFS family permease